MFLRSVIVCCYLMMAYWVSVQYPSLKMVFYPTLGAFSFLFMHRADRIGEVGRIIMGAAISVTIGSVMYAISPGAASFFFTAFCTILLIQFFKWNAAPILAVSLIPFFAHPVTMWALPLAVLASLIGLLVPIWFIGWMERTALLLRIAQLFSGKPMEMKKELS
ncbi:hypothetical protein ACFFK0_02205 [Paenibacillus chartarius]|uniref:HPP family protein n=1 Tax=Paenibacillus chartarius TaxID=747481 RepID=A0ABV6DF42_9BACL